jgi:hypothetical protein
MEVRVQAELANIWSLNGADFPATGNRREQLRFIARYAALAPSTHNTQPWTFEISQTALAIFADRRRSLAICDPRDRELTISCGAALQFAVLTARNYGHLVETDILPDRSNPDLLARMRLRAPCGPSPAEERRFRAILDRHTNRTKFDWASPHQARAIERLPELADAHGVAFRLLAGRPEIAAAAALVGRADRLQMADGPYRRELARWIGPRSRADGMSVASFGLEDRWSGPIATLLERLNGGWATARKHETLVNSATWLGLLGSQEDTAEAWMRTGRALADILLEISASGLATSFANQPIQVPALRPRLGQLFSQESWPQMLIRIGVADPIEHAARRQPDLVLAER